MPACHNPQRTAIQIVRTISWAESAIVRLLSLAAYHAGKVERALCRRRWGGVKAGGACCGVLV